MLMSRIKAKDWGAFCPFSCINNSATYKTRMNNYYTYAYLREDCTPQRQRRKCVLRGREDVL